MVTELAAPMTQQSRRRRRLAQGRRGWELRLARTLAFLAAAALVLVYALRGGSYALIVRQENGLVVWWILAVGIALGVLPRRRPGRAVSVALGTLLVYCGWIALSLIWTESAERTTGELARTLDYIGLVALIGAVLDRDTWRAAALGLGAGAFAVCGVALASRLAPAVVSPGGAPLVFGTTRLSYPFGYWNAVGAWGSMCTAFALAWSANDRRPVPRMASLALVPLAVTVTYLSYSRAAVGGTALAALAAVALSRQRWSALLHAAAAAAGSAACIAIIRSQPELAHGTGTAGAGRLLVTLLGAAVLGALVAGVSGRAGTDRWRLARGHAFVLAGAVGAVLLVAGIAIGPRLASRAWNEFRHPKIAQTADPAARLNSLNGTRYQLWKVALQGFDARPMTGTGAGTFEFWWNRHATTGEFVRNAHSLWIESLSELGLPGLLAIVAFALSALFAGGLARRRARRSASVAACAAATAAFLVFLLQASVDWMWQSTAVTVLALAGVAVAGARLCGDRPRWRLPVRAGVVLAAAIAGAIQIPGLLSAAEINASQAAARRGDSAAALSWARDAVSAEPWAASPYLQRGLVLEEQGRLVPAAADLHRAITREPTNFRHWLVLARIEAEEGRAAAAMRDYDHGRRLRPYAAVFRVLGPH